MGQYWTNVSCKSSRVREELATGEYGNLAAAKEESDKRLAIEDAPAKVNVSKEQAKRLASSKAEAEERQRKNRRVKSNRAEAMRRREIKE